MASHPRIARYEVSLGAFFPPLTPSRQYMGFFASFLICHLYFRHRFSSSGIPFLDFAWRTFLYLALVSWAAIVAYSRFHLMYHTPHQILWGLGIGTVFGISLYCIAELIPFQSPNSTLGKTRIFLVANPVSTWLQLRDGWMVWGDAGREADWERWRTHWERRFLVKNQGEKTE